uniref:ATP synthase complex subunit 8 n=1 Tax=Polygraphus poligraphus TaxID=516982 RepID=A0A8F4WGG3_9CUCU|nr:ATP synthase F0 subunit 8 [Polygraphus poligraphus]QXG82896.1 ATP synthase F0 subunit 8 [Polygraphus poligraphus]UJX85651.1 ATP synthase F0 subunit 8 [Polygraphus poligraphus]
MPQMAPMNWTALLFLFIFFFLLYIVMNYFSFMNQPSNKPSIFPTTKKMNWKW